MNIVMEESFTSDRQQVIMWGTNINIDDIEKKFEQFLCTFKVIFLFRLKKTKKKNTKFRLQTEKVQCN